MMDHKNSLTVALTIDFDAESAIVDAGNTNPTALSRGRYGAIEGVKRIVNLFKRFAIRGTCFIPAYTVKKYPAQCKMFLDAGFEIGHHGCQHEAPLNKSFTEEQEIIECGLEAIDKILHLTPKGYRAPWLKQTENTYKLLIKYGFDYDSSECAQDSPYYIDVDGKRDYLERIRLNHNRSRIL